MISYLLCGVCYFLIKFILYDNKIVKLINESKGEKHLTMPSIRECAQKLLADKKKIDDFMQYDRKRKLDKV